jgi:hypothetical protein
VKVEGVHTMFKEIGLEALLVHYLASAHHPDYSPNITKEEKIVREEAIHIWDYVGT